VAGFDRRFELRGADAVDPADTQRAQADSDQSFGGLNTHKKDLLLQVFFSP
jgi:hypothetical protein